MTMTVGIVAMTATEIGIGTVTGTGDTEDIIVRKSIG
jgi:hypothetical protein